MYAERAVDAQLPLSPPPAPHSLPGCYRTRLWVARCRQRVDGRDFGGRTALHYAALHDDLSLLQWLLAHHADISLQDGQGQTPLHLALKEKHKRVVQTLLQQPQVRVDVLDQFNRSCLHWAAQASHKHTNTPLGRHNPSTALLCARRAHKFGISQWSS